MANKAYDVIVNGHVIAKATTPAGAAQHVRCVGITYFGESSDTNVPAESYLVDRFLPLVPGEGTVINSADPRIVVKRVGA